MNARILIAAVLLVGLALAPLPAADCHAYPLADLPVVASGASDVQRPAMDRSAAPFAAAGLPGAPSWSGESNQADAFYGGFLDSAGDVNGDGYEDLIVSAHLYDKGQTDEGAVFVYYGSPTGPSPTPNWMAEGNQAGAEFGQSAAGAGDLNGDGYDDIVIGAYAYSNGQAGEGAAFVYYGSATGLGAGGTPANADWKVEINVEDAHLGTAVDTAGDVNGDGYDDLIVGAYFYPDDPALPDPNHQAGLALVFYGSATGLGPNGTLANADWQLHGWGNAGIGADVDTAGDVNGDGYDDVIISAPWANQVRVYWGSASGLGSTYWYATRYLDHADFGRSAAGAGDLNGDGYDDIVVGSPGLWVPPTYQTVGAAYVWLGGPEGLGPAGTPENADWSRQTSYTGQLYGWSVADAGDLDGDGYGDLVVGAKDWVYYQSSIRYNVPGGAYVYYGSPAGPHPWTGWSAQHGYGEMYGCAVAPAGDVNRDGSGDLLVGSMYESHGESREGRAHVYLGSARPAMAADLRLDGGRDQGLFGSAVGTAGDVNGDGYPELLIGEPYNWESYAGPGRASVFTGSGTGLITTTAWVTTSVANNNRLGCAVASGDFDGDGKDDVAIGADRYSGAQPVEGAVFVYNGSAGGLVTALSWFTESLDYDAALGQPLFGYALATGDVNDDGYDDLVVGEPWYGGWQSGPGRALVYCGSATGLPITPTWTATGRPDSDYGAHIGWSVGTGDFDGDGSDDVIVGATRFYSSVTGGGAFVWYGSTAGLGDPGTPANADWTVVGDLYLGDLGSVVGSAGDVNGDGCDEAIVATPWYDVSATAPLTNAGAVFIWYGSEDGLGPGGDCSTADWITYGDRMDIQLGSAANGAGDLDGDGYDDVVIGAPGYGAHGPYEGRAFVYYGSAAGLASAPLWEANVDQRYARFGTAVSGAGDLNGDGYDDLVAGAPGYGLLSSGGEYYSSSRGAAFVYYGQGRIGGVSASNDGPTQVGATTTLTATLAAGSGVAMSWSFGDGTTGIGATVTHTYAHAGAYSARATATNRLGQGTASTVVQVYDVLDATPGAPPVSTSDGVLTLGGLSGLTGAVTITYTPEAGPAKGGMGILTFGNVAFQLVATDAGGSPVHTFSPPLTLTVHYNGAALPPSLREADLKLYRWDDVLAQWVALPVLARDTVADTFTVRLDHLSEFAIVQPILWVQLPMVLR